MGHSYGLSLEKGLHRIFLCLQLSHIHLLTQGSLGNLVKLFTKEEEEMGLSSRHTVPGADNKFYIQKNFQFYIDWSYVVLYNFSISIVEYTFQNNYVKVTSLDQLCIDRNLVP